MTKSDRWILSEWLVAKDRVFRYGEPLIHHRQKTPYAEVDLIFGPSTQGAPFTIIEVKSVAPRTKRSLWAGEVISRSQIVRLEKARWYVELKARTPVRLLLATVEARSEGGEPVIRYFEAPF